MWKLIFHLLLLLSFLLTIITGWIKAFGSSHSELLDQFHQASGLTLSVLALVHLYLYRRVMRAMIESYRHTQQPPHTNP